MSLALGNGALALMLTVVTNVLGVFTAGIRNRLSDWSTLCN